MSSLATLSPPPLMQPLQSRDGRIAPPWALWLQQLWDGQRDVSSTLSGGTYLSIASVGASPNAAAATLSSNILTLQPASAAHPGLLSAADYSKLSGVAARATRGLTTLAAVGSSPNSSGASISDVTLTLQPADATNPGQLTATAQNIGGAKAFQAAVTMASTLGVTGAVTLGSTLGVTGAATVGGTLGVTGAATLSSALGVTGAATLSSTLGVTGAAAFSSTVTLSGSGALVSISNTSATGYSTTRFLDSGGTYKGGIGWGNATVVATDQRNVLSWDAATGVDWLWTVNGVKQGTFASTGAVSFTGTLAVTGNVTVATTALVTDVTNKWLGIGISPSVPLHVESAVASTTSGRIRNTSTSGFSALAFYDAGNTARCGIGVGNSATASPYTSNVYFQGVNGSDIVFLTGSTGTASERMRLANGGNLTVATNALYVDATNKWIGIGITPTQPFHITGSVSAGGIGRIQSTVTNGFSSFACADSSNNTRVSFGYGNSATPSPYTSTAYFYHVSTDFILARDVSGVVSEYFRGAVASGNITMQNALNVIGALTHNSITVLDQTNTVTGITNKTFTTPTINGAAFTGTLSGSPDFSGSPTVGSSAIVTLAATQTLAAKTLTSPTINGATVSGTFTGALTMASVVTFSSVPVASGMTAPAAGGLTFTSNIADVATNTAHVFETGTSLSGTSGVNMAAFRNAGVERVFIDGNGGIGRPTAPLPLAVPRATGGLFISQLASPSSVVATPSLTGGSLSAGTYSYYVVAANSIGQTVGTNVTATIASGTTGSVVLTWGYVFGATSYRIYGRTSGTEQLIATVSGAKVLTYTDTGSITPSGALLTVNSTGAVQPEIDATIQLGATALRFERLCVSNFVATNGLRSNFDSISQTRLNIATALNLSTGAATDSATAVANASDNSVALPTAGAKIHSFRTATVEKAYVSGTGALGFDSSDSSGTPGNATINRPSGKSAFAAGSATLVITNNQVIASTKVFYALQTNDATLTDVKSAIPALGSFTLTGNAAATAATNVVWFIVY